MIVHACICRDAEWILPYHLEAYSAFCDRIVVVLDRSPQLERICRQFPKVLTRLHYPRQPIADFNARGILMEEGYLRQLAWDLAAAYHPDWIALGDADEVPTPDVMDFKPSPDVDCYYAHWVNLWMDRRHALGGKDAKWSFQNPNGNKKGFLVRRRPGVAYHYDITKQQHTRMEPNPVHPARAVIDPAHVLLDSPKLIHHKYSRASWLSDPLRASGGQYSTMESDATIVSVPDEWQWPGVDRL